LLCRLLLSKILRLKVAAVGRRTHTHTHTHTTRVCLLSHAPPQEPYLADLPADERRLQSEMAVNDVSIEALLSHPHVQVGCSGACARVFSCPAPCSLLPDLRCPLLQIQALTEDPR